MGEVRDQIVFSCLPRCLTEHINMNILKYLKQGILTISLYIVLSVNTARATEVMVGSAKGKAGSEIQLPLSLDKIDNMAGVKIVLSYDQDILEFLKAEKTEKS